MTPRKSSILILFSIAAVIAAIFFPVLDYDWMPIEDPSYYKTNPLFGESPLLNRLIAAWFNAPESNYIPLTWNFTTLLAEVSNHSAQAFHSASLLLHLCNSILGFVLLRRWGVKTPVATITILIFALHPLRVESVAWASSIKGLLAAFFAILVLLLQSFPHLRFRPLMIIICFLLSLLSKQSLLLLPAALYLLERVCPEYKLKKTSYVTLGILTLLAGVTASLANTGNSLTAINQANEGSISFIKALAALGHQFYTQIFPLSLFPEYPVNKHWALIVLGGLAILPLLAIFKSFVTKKPLHPILILYAGFFILLFPALGLIATPLEFAADRLSYLPSLFLWASLGYALNQLSLKGGKKTLYVIPIIFLGCLVSLTIRQIIFWKDDSTLTNHILNCSPDHYIANIHLANQYGLAGEFDAALPYAESLIKNHPYRYGGWKTYSQIQIQRRQPQIALKALVSTLAEPTPIRADLHITCCDLYRALNQFDEALKSSEQARKHGINNLTFHYQNALTYFAANDLLQARNEIQQALKHSPRNSLALTLKDKIEARTP